jgi:hypothetical protein
MADFGISDNVASQKLPLVVLFHISASDEFFEIDQINIADKYTKRPMNCQQINSLNYLFGRNGIEQF